MLDGERKQRSKAHASFPKENDIARKSSKKRTIEENILEQTFGCFQLK